MGMSCIFYCSHAMTFCLEIIIVKQEGVYVYLVEGFYSKSSFGSIIFNISNLIKLLFLISYMSKIICVSV